MQFTRESVGFTVEGEECGVGEERANTFFTGAIDYDRVDIRNVERSVVDDTYIHASHVDGHQPTQEQSEDVP